MMDELELLKKDWQKQEASLPKYTAADIYPMLHKKSSSIVKWIFIVGLVEFAFWIILSFAFNDADQKEFTEANGLQTFNIVALVIHLSALTFFLGWFYKNFRKISATDTARGLMRSIIRTRKTVKYYIWFSIMYLLISAVIAFILVINNNPEVNSSENFIQMIAVFIAIITVIAGLLLLAYRVIYGILMRRLKRNYKELKKLEL